ncbi:peptidoglycan DD-metalloendopeptidase family protein [Microbacterium jejuense]|uniref:Peptidoglycan DD-metalloendopeptidase family protein n=1 Tax=Microbacterium jejuense TaxID=1263637 RepID=A0ABS7HPN4_9MICO|nr:M23 family metallopeptidase [Microbacterium jejuense]MBW9094926.1 peptidoglycan DD-metalloendopeptidase family protein [Microbacterium jejuense]
MNRRTALGIGILGVAALSSFGTALNPFGSRAYAADYPSWDDVQAAKANETAKAAEITNIQNLIAGLEAEVAAKQQLAKQAGDEFYAAQQEFFVAAWRADELQRQADEQAAAADDAATKAGRVAAQLYRNGGDDTSMELFFSGSAAGADDLLTRLGTMDKLVERNQDLYAQAVTARDSAQSLSDQAAVQRTERDRLQKIAEEKMIAAQQAAEAAQAALDAQNAKKGELEAQLAALQDTTARTIAEYQEGERIRKEAEEKARREAEEKARRDAEAASGGGGGGGGGGGAVVGSGWARPSSGWQSSGYGWRASQCGSQGCASTFHAGVDLAAGCGAGIYAASAGRVVYAGYNGGYGNYVKIDHGGGIGTGYGHIRNGGIFVGVGQWVSAGQLIASEGNTGRSFGCHCHFEVYVNGGTVNPVPFMAARGISV